jgi:hypothetical protein
MTDQDHQDLIAELVSLPHWRSLRRELRGFMKALEEQVLQPSSNPMDLIRKEAVSYALRELQRFFNGIEANAERHVRNPSQSS